MENSVRINMTNFHKVIINNMARMCKSKYFFISILMNFLLMMLGYIYTDMGNGETYSVFTLLLSKNLKTILEQSGLNWKTTYITESPGYTWMFTPVVVTLPFIAVICAGNANSSTRYEMIRTSKKSYIVGRIIAGIIMAGLITLLSQIMYGFACYGIIGNVNNAGDSINIICENSSIIKTLHLPKKFISLYVLRGTAAFLYGMSSSFLVISLSALIKNKYLVFSIPFMINYFWNMSVNNGLFKIIKNEKVIQNINLLLIKTNMQVLFLHEKIIISLMLVILVLEIFGIYLINIIAVERRCDCCER